MESKQAKQLEIGARRRCDFDGRLYTVRKPDHRFCCDKCRSSFHRYGSAYLIVRERIGKEVADQVTLQLERVTADMEARILAVLDQPTRLRYTQLFPERMRRLERHLPATASRRVSEMREPAPGAAAAS